MKPLIFIPIDLLIQEKPSSIPLFFKEFYTGLSEKTIKNGIQGKREFSEKSINTLTENASNYFNNIPYVNFNSSNFKETLLNITNSPDLNFVTDELLAYSSNIFIEILNCQKILKSNYSATSTNKSKIENNSFFPIFSEIFNAHLNNSASSQIAMNKTRVEILFLYLSAVESDYLNILYKRKDSVVSNFLPQLNNKQNIIFPIEVFFHFIKEKYGHKTLEQLANEIESCNKKDNFDMLRNIYKYINVNKNIFPSDITIFHISYFMSCKNKTTDKDHIKEVEEQTKFIFKHLKIFQNILKKLILPNKELYGLTSCDAVKFFTRYSKWYQYHTNNKKSITELNSHQAP